MPSHFHQYQRQVSFLRLVAVGFALLCESVLLASTRSVDLEIQFTGIQKLTDGSGAALRLSRLDLILSELALQRMDGSWLSTQGWQGFYSQSAGRVRQTLTGVPEEEFQAIRFLVGVPQQLNHADPHALPAEHPLHLRHGMHWGWAGGYIFLAMEGHSAQQQGFSYHLATDEMATQITLPAQLQMKQTGTLLVQLDASQLLTGVTLEKDGLSTHSRAEDALAQKLQGNLAKAFRWAGARSDRFQELAPAAPTAQPLRPGLQAYPLSYSARLPKPQLPVDNPLSQEGVALGSSLFHDRRLSQDGSLSCASCHAASAAFSDAGKSVSLGVGGAKGRRNAMPLFNLAWASSFFWDGRAPSLREQALMPITDAHEMAEQLPVVVAKLSRDADLVQQFERVFGPGGITAARMGLALEQFMLTLVAQDSRFDRAARGELQLTAQELQGLQLFVTENDPARGLRGADCFHCHGGNLFTNGQLMNNGLPHTADSGRYAVTGKEEDRAKFKVPSLRNLPLTAPYMHDGSLPNLEAVVEHYDHGVVRHSNLDPNLAKHSATGLGLTPAEKSALVAFLRALSDEPSPAVAAR